MNPASGRHGHARDAFHHLIARRLVNVSCLICLVALTASAENIPKDEYKIKAEYLYNFAKLVEWPTNTFTRADSPLQIGVVGDDSFDTLLRDAVKGKKVGGHKIAVQHFSETNPVDSCQILFIHRSARDQQSDLLKTVAGKSILTVGETEGFLDQGGIIRFVPVDGAVRFEIFLDAAERARLRISSKLLLLARPAYRPPKPKDDN